MIITFMFLPLIISVISFFHLIFNTVGLIFITDIIIDRIIFIIGIIISLILAEFPLIIIPIHLIIFLRILLVMYSSST